MPTTEGLVEEGRNTANISPSSLSFPSSPSFIVFTKLLKYFQGRCTRFPDDLKFRGRIANCTE